MTDPTEDKLESQANRLFPHIREKLHSEDELSTHAKKLYPHMQDEFHRDIGRSVVTETTGMLRKALWAVVGAAVAFLSFKWLGK